MSSLVMAYSAAPGTSDGSAGLQPTRHTNTGHITNHNNGPSRRRGGRRSERCAKRFRHGHHAYALHSLPYLPPTAMRTVSAVSSFSCPFSTYLHTGHRRTGEHVRGSGLITKPWRPYGLYSRTQRRCQRDVDTSMPVILLLLLDSLDVVRGGEARQAVDVGHLRDTRRRRHRRVRAARQAAGIPSCDECRAALSPGVP